MANYISDSEANTYVNSYKLKISPAWANSTQKTVALTKATRIINRLPFIGEKTDDSQVNAFPRGGDTQVPQDIEDACAELAYSLIDGRDPEFEFDDLKVKSKSFGSASITTSDKISSVHIAAGIVSYDAWILLLPYLRPLDSIDVERVS